MLFFNVVKVFVIPILLAAVLTALFYPLYERLLRLFRGRRGLSSIVCCLVLFLGMLVPLYVVADLVSREVIAFYQKAVPAIREIIQQGDAGLLGRIKAWPIFSRVDFSQVDWQASLQDILRNSSRVIATVIDKTSRSTFQVVANLFITLFTLFYFFKDGPDVLKRLKYLSPLDDRHEDELIHRFVSISRATIKGTLVIGVVQGTLGGLTLWIFGVGQPVLWGVVMVILSVIPLVGSWLVLYPAGIIQLIVGNIWQGVGILLVSAIVIGNIDNLLRPRLVGREAGMHDLLIFFSTLGGMSLFGVLGFILGPVIAVFFLTLLDIYSIEFKPTLDVASSGAVSTPKSVESEDS